MPTLTNRWAVLALMFLVGMAEPMLFQSVAAFAPFLTAQVGFSYTQVGVLAGLFMLPGSFIALPGGMLGARLGDKTVIVGGLSLMLVGSLVFAQSNNLTVMSAGRLLGGAGAVLLSIQRAKVITDWFAGKEISTAMAIIAASFGLGVGIAMPALGGIAAATSWETATYINGAFIGLALVVVVLFYKDLPTRKADTPDEAPRIWGISRPELWLTSIAGTAYAYLGTGYVVFMSFTPLLLIEQGLSVASAGVLVGFVAVVSIGSVPLGGYLTDRVGKPNWFITVGAVGAGAACFMVPVWGPAILWILLFGLLRGGCTGGIMALPSEVLRPESRSTGFGVFYTVFYFGMALIPPAAGYLRDSSGNSEAAIWFGGMLWLLIIASLALFRLLQNRWLSKEILATNTPI